MTIDHYQVDNCREASTGSLPGWSSPRRCWGACRSSSWSSFTSSLTSSSTVPSTSSSVSSLSCDYFTFWHIFPGQSLWFFKISRWLRRRKSPWLDTKNWSLERALPLLPDLKIAWVQSKGDTLVIAAHCSGNLYWPKKLKYILLNTD